MSTRIIVALLMVAALGACRSSKNDRADTSSVEVAEYVEASNPIVRARLQARVDNIKYQKGVTLVTNLERIANYGEMAIPVCVEGLASDDAMTRMGCVWVLGRVGDTRVIPDLENLLEDEAAYVRYEAASQLGNLGTRSGYRVLVQGLSSEKLEYRFKCIEALRELTGHTFDYSHNAAPDVRSGAVKQWQQWLEKVESEEL